MCGNFKGIYQALDSEKRVTNFNYINNSFCDAKFLIKNVKKAKTKTNNIYLEYFVVAQVSLKNSETILNLNIPTRTRTISEN